jgi:hypothetical protein
MLSRTPTEVLSSSSVVELSPDGTALAQYETACRALAEVRAIDEVQSIRNKAVAIAAYAKQAKNKQLQADAVEIQMRATRRLGQLIEEQKKTVGLAKGSKGQLRGRTASGGIKITPPEALPTLGSQGIDKNLARQARKLAALSKQKFKEAITNARAATLRVLPSVVKIIEAGDSRRRSHQDQTPTVSRAVAVLLNACVQIDEADAVRAYLNKLRNPSDIIVVPEKFEGAARSVHQKLAAQHRRRAA